MIITNQADLNIVVFTFCGVCVSDFSPSVSSIFGFGCCLVILNLAIEVLLYAFLNRNCDTVSLKQTGQFIEALTTLTWPYKT